MRRAAVGSYCALVDRFDLLVSTRTLAARETQTVCNQWAGNMRTWLGALNLGSGEGWQRESENRAPRPMGVYPQSSAVGIGLPFVMRPLPHRAEARPVVK